jgi:hypothetical protein
LLRHKFGGIYNRRLCQEKKDGSSRQSKWFDENDVKHLSPLPSPKETSRTWFTSDFYTQFVSILSFSIYVKALMLPHKARGKETRRKWRESRSEWSRKYFRSCKSQSVCMRKNSSPFVV